MKAFINMTIAEFKLFFREPVAFFFTLAFPMMLLFIFGSIWGNEPSEFYGGLGSVDVSVPAYIGMIIGTVGLLGLPITLATYREHGVLRRMSTTPVDAAVIMGAQVIVNLVISFLGSLLLVAAGRIFYDMQMPVSAWAMVPAFILSSVAFFAVSFVIAGLSPSSRVAQVVGMVIFYPMLFLSGAAMPREGMPEAILRWTEWLPLTQVVTLFKEVWFNNVWPTTAVVTLIGMAVIGAIVSRYTFRWE